MTILRLKNILIIMLLIVLSIQLISPVSNAEQTSNEQVSYNVWKLSQWNDNIPLDWYSKGFNVNASEGSNVSYNITQSTTNMTDPNSGYFSIGNVTNISTDNYDLSNVFALSIWPWFPGFVTIPGNWSGQIAEAQLGASSNYLNGSLKINQGSFKVSNYNRTTYEFIFNQSLTSGNQNTTLIYDKQTGVLLYGYCELNFGTLYKIGLNLLSSTLISSNDISTSSGTTSVPSLTVTVFLILFGLLSYIRLVKERKKH